MTEPSLTRLQKAEQKQAAAADPQVSAWVRANAGTGKTHVLVWRILRLLLSGVEPRSILCLTFTKNAAAEMEARVVSELGKWATASPADLAKKLDKIQGRCASPEEEERARTLFAQVVDAPGGLSAMTIHSFCERVLRRYAFEANVPAGFSVLTEEDAKEALDEAIAAALQPTAKPDLDQLVAFAAEAQFAKVLRAMLQKRVELARVLKLSTSPDPLDDVLVRLRRLFQVAEADTYASLMEAAAETLSDTTLSALAQLLAQGSPTDQTTAGSVQAVIAAPSSGARIAAFAKLFLTDKLTPRKSLMTKKTQEKAGFLYKAFCDAQDHFANLHERLCALKAIEATAVLLRLTMAIFEGYDAAKRARAALDFDDLIERTLDLLIRGDAAEWVLYQLDSRIDHILVDEAQDTAPAQWAILERLTSDFFAGQGMRETPATLFAVGDEKQSIYGFQGARPEFLAGNGFLYEEKVRQAKLEWRAVDLDLSFRTLKPILESVDAVCASLPQFTESGLVPHQTNRTGDGGLVEIWQPHQAETQEKASPFEPEKEEEATKKPSQALADEIADEIERWLAEKPVLPSTNKPIESGDILILLRKREPMAQLLQTALKARGIAVAGTDRVALLETLAVMDLLALMDALLLPDDDLALATVLKSPLFDVSEDALYQLCQGRGSSLWQTLIEANHAAAADLKRWRDLAQTASPFVFLTQILESENYRYRFATRLGNTCHDALNELMTLAESFSARPHATLSSFLPFVRNSASEIKREGDQTSGEVRIMTVHGAKGLEANVVIVADTCRVGAGSPPPVYFLEDPEFDITLPLWAVKGTSHLAPLAEAKAALKQANARESARLLYVALTRARDHLYLAGFHRGNAPETGSWHELVWQALAPTLKNYEDVNTGRKRWRMYTDHTSRIDAFSE